MEKKLKTETQIKYPGAYIHSPTQGIEVLLECVSLNFGEWYIEIRIGHSYNSWGLHVWYACGIVERTWI